MGEALVLVCDRCGQPAVETVSFRAAGNNLVIDLCEPHLDELVAGARVPKRGRKPTTVRIAAQPKRRGRPPGSKNKTTRKKPAARKKATTRKRTSAK